ncbi:TPA: hypothetical protein QDB24_002304 [Burkholderia vietnamiensis]|uniref:hypothetical protein n=1 Tax=Burkholderia vietnamiensis TaxID=60552 RepID=UPI001B938A3B|nr:hypothetical protein [Burkholderia vietnamiensis]MBR7910020.1 hypothetical protein [Burkholderia vietnamiensis]HDR9274240.1 hypothetical protein [Burkholderia vietnamiensis]
MALTAAEQKQIREALCAIAVCWSRFLDELQQARQNLTQQFEALKAAATPQAAAEK